MGASVAEGPPDVAGDTEERGGRGGPGEVPADVREDVST
jgi:hypothetical protein